MREREVIAVLETMKKDSCKIEKEALSHAINCIKQMAKLKKFIKRWEIKPIGDVEYVNTFEDDLK